jgi:glycine hydroxymethyltransferase
VYRAALSPGDTILAMNLDHGGHLTHGSPANFSGQLYKIIPYGVRQADELIDYDALREAARAHRPKLIQCGATAYSRAIDFARFREIADEVGALLFADVAHIAGLIVGGAHPSPVGHADIISTTTHKTLRGPRGAMLMTTAEHATVIDKAVFPGLQGGPHNHTTAGIAVALHEAAQPSFATYAHQIVSNAKALAAALNERGFDLVSGGTDNHLILIDLTNKGVEGKPAAKALDRAGIELNFNTVPYDPRKPWAPSGIRLGTPALTTRGLTEQHMPAVAGWMDEAVTAAVKDDDAALDRIAAEVSSLLSSFPMPGYRTTP